MSNKMVSLALTLGVLASIDPDAYAPGTFTSGWVSAADWRDFMAVVSVGDLGAAATIDAKIEQATSAAGAGAKDLTGSAITQLTKAGTDDNKQAVIAFSTADLDMSGAFGFVRLSLTVATAASDAAMILIGSGCRYGPAGDSDAATVDEIVTV